MKKVLKKFKINTPAIWNQILEDGGSVQNIKELDDKFFGHFEDIPVKEVFKTFKEINQLELVNQAGIRQQYIDQSVSLNLALSVTRQTTFIHCFSCNIASKNAFSSCVI